MTITIQGITFGPLSDRTTEEAIRWAWSQLVGTNNEVVLRATSLERMNAALWMIKVDTYFAGYAHVS
jgi:lipase chaperone LimK